MEVTIMTGLFTEWYVDVDAGHYFLTRPSFCFTKLAHPE